MLVYARVVQSPPGPPGEVGCLGAVGGERLEVDDGGDHPARVDGCRAGKGPGNDEWEPGRPVVGHQGHHRDAGPEFDGEGAAHQGVDVGRERGHRPASMAWIPSTHRPVGVWRP